ncbi:BBE domain-containing protein [Actinoallomurus vinaceus]|uniref:BBE domain-containing protein n=1 Tax=Actinoallomurus vinaceus TaxID=1080074 RepID=A0ABP8U1L7_9ACTN
MDEQVVGGSAGEMPDDAAGAHVSPAASVTPNDPQYADCVRGGNQRYIGAPESVRIVNSTEQVVQVVQEAVDNDKRLTVISSGHCFEDFIFSPDVQIVIDMSQMDRTYYDPARNAVAVESGATLLKIYETMYKEWGVTIPAGLCYSVAAGGHVSGGAWGPSSRDHGLVVDHLYAVEVVVVRGNGRAHAVVATRDPNDPNHDLWWAHTGGGGGNFGVVTRYWFRSPGATGTDPRGLLPQPPKELLLSAIAWSWNDIDQTAFMNLARNYASWHVHNGDADNPLRAVTSYLILNHRSNGQLGLITQVDATVPGAEQIFADYLRYITDGVSAKTGALTNAMTEHSPKPQFAEPIRLPWLEATRFNGTTNPAQNDPTYRAEFKSTFMRGVFPDQQLAALYQGLNAPTINNPLVGVQFTPYGGRTRAVAPTATASVHRGAAFKMLFSAQWHDPTQDDVHISWARDTYGSLYPDTGGVPVPNDVTDGCYVNYPDADLSDPLYNRSGTPWYTLYYKENYPRLQQIKRRWDPRNFFRHRQSVQLP